MSISNQSFHQDLTRNLHDGYSVRVCTTAGEVEALRDIWTGWQSHPNADIDFFSLILGLRPNFKRPFVVVVSEGMKPVALLAGREEVGDETFRIGYLNLFKAKLSTLSFVYGGAMGQISEQIAALLVDKIVASLKERRLDAVRFDHLPVNSALYTAVRTLPAALMRDGHIETSPHWRMKVSATLEEFLKKRKKKHRYWLNRITRILDEAFPGRVEVRVFEREEDVPKLCEDSEEISKTTYQRSLGVGFVRNHEHQKRLEFAARHKRLGGFILYIDGKPKGFWTGTFYQDVFYLVWTGYDPALRQYELGTVLFLKVIEALGRRGVQEVDFGVGTAPYKERFGDYSWEEATVRIFAPTLRGVGLNCLATLTSGFTRTAKVILAKLKVQNAIKRYWRGKLADS